MTQTTDTSNFPLLAHEAGFDPIEERLRMNVRATIEAVFEEELASFLGRLRYDRGDGAAKGYRHGHRERQLTGTFGTETVRVPRARIEGDAGKVTEWRSKALPRYQRLTKKAEALIAAVYLAGTNTRRVKRALFGLFEGTVSKDVVSRAWRKVKVDWDAWCARSLADEDIVRLILGECPIFCVTGIWSMLPGRSKNYDHFQGTTGRVAEGLRAAGGFAWRCRADERAEDQAHGAGAGGRVDRASGL
jgi:hypothetical protein